MNAVPFALEDQRDALRHDGAAIFDDDNVVLKIARRARISPLRRR